MLQFYDFEVFKYDWLVVIIDPANRSERVIVNNKQQLEDYYNEHKNDIWIGYNSRGYDQYILKGILCDFNPYEISKHIVFDKKPGYSFSRLFNQFQLINYDVMSNKNMGSLKTLEGFMGNDIRETEVSFNLDRKLTPKELELTIYYCRHDVEQTIEVFLQKKTEFDSQLSLIKTFNLPLSYIGKTQAQLAAIILNAKPVKFNDDWNIRVPETLQLNKYKFASDWFLNKENHNENSSLTCTIAGCEHVVAWGGLHGALSKYSYTCKSDELLVMADVDQLYPTIMIKYKLLSRGVIDYEKFKHILSESLRLKALKKKKEREPYKRICNITYGAEGDEFNAMYDPLHRKLVCVYGQLLILDLIEKIEILPDFKLIQSNTDGILIKIKEKDFDLLDDLIYEWEKRTGLHMSFDCYKKVVQKDVNNYVVVPFGELYDEKGKPTWKSKGAYVKSLSPLDNDLPIVNEAMVKYITQNIPIEKTILECNDLIKFQKIVKISGKYMHGLHNRKKLTDKTFRVFASKIVNDTSIYKVKNLDKNPEKFANTPEHCFIDNNDIKDKQVPDKLDKKWYIDLTNERLKQFGVI